MPAKRLPLFVLRALLTVVLLAFSARGFSQTPLPAGEPLVAGDPLSAFKLQTDPAQPGAAEFSTVNVTGPNFTRAWRVATTRDAAPIASIELRAVNAHPIAEGDVGMIRFFARSTFASDETGGARLMIVVRRNGVDFNSSYEGDFSFRAEWQEILIPFVAAKDFPTGDLAIMFQFGFKKQTLEIGGLEVISYGKKVPLSSLPRTRFSYPGAEADAPWRKAALERIERIRKGDLSVRVVDAAGKPVEGAHLHLEEKRSAFQWGSALQMKRLVNDSPDDRRYREKVLELFNEASTENDLKWPVWLGEWGEDYSRANTLAGLRWLHDNSFYLRGHVLVWPGRKNLPLSVQSLLGTPWQKLIPDLIRAHIHEMAEATKGLLNEWDVLNEPYTNHDLMDAFGREIMPTWFEAAREEMPTLPLFLNDFSNHDLTTDAAHIEYFEGVARYLIDHHAPVGGLGLQAHFNGHPNAPEQILRVLDRYDKEFHLPVRFTEFDVWTFDEDLQAAYTRDFFILAFSHPSVVGVQLWGFWENAHWRPPAAMYRADWSEKKNAEVYRSLVLQEWRTRLDGTTDRDGQFGARGFFGDYSVEVEHDGRRTQKTFSLRSDTPHPVITVTLPSP